MDLSVATVEPECVQRLHICTGVQGFRWLQVSGNNELFVDFLAADNLVCDLIWAPGEQWDEDELFTIPTSKIFKIIFLCQVYTYFLEKIFPGKQTDERSHN